MIRFYDWAITKWAARQRVHRKSLAAALAAAALLQPTFAWAATIDWNVVGPENYDSTQPPDTGGTLNWMDKTQSNTTVIPVSPPGTTPVSIPANTDDAVVRNGGTVEITTAIMNNRLDVGFARTVATDDGVIITPTEAGGNGTVNMTDGSLTGSGANGLQLRLGGTGLASAGSPQFTGIFNQSGGTVTMGVAGNPGSILVIGAGSSTSTPTSQYNLMPGGTINMVTGVANNNGINVRNGTFNMTGGSIIGSGTGASARFMHIATTNGAAVGSETVATANFSGGIVDAKGGVRMALNNHTKAYMTISGSADVEIIGSDFELGVNNTNAYAQVDMSGGSFAVGGPTDAPGSTRRLIIGNTGIGGAGTTGSTGVFNLSGGTVNLYNSLVLANNGGAKGTLNMTGGTLTIRSVELTRNAGTYDLTQDTAVISINGPNALFKQENNASGTGQVIIGGVGKARFEVLQGEARVREFRVSDTANSRATLTVAGGKLVVQDGVTRTDATAPTVPVINLTGGELELTPALGAISWQAGMELLGTDFDPKPLALLQTNIGNSTRPGNFSLNTGSIWDLDIASNTLLGGADWVDVNLGTAALNGGVLNIHHIGGYTPAPGHTVTILRNLLAGVTLGAVTVSDPNWVPILAGAGGNTEIRLVYIPEPSSLLLFGVGLAMFSATRRTSRK